MQAFDQGGESAELLDLLAKESGNTELLNSLARVTSQHLSEHHQVLCGITQRRRDKNTVVASCSAEAQSMDEVQAGFDEGPCLEAQRTERVISVEDVRAETRWPKYMQVVRDSGYRSILAVPLELNGLAVAAMNIYAESAGALREQVPAALRYAQLASKVMVVGLRIAAYADHVHDRRQAMESRTAIDLAAGIIMGQQRCSQQEAMNLLKQASSRRNVKLRVMAEELVRSMGEAAPESSFAPAP